MRRLSSSRIRIEGSAVRVWTVKREVFWIWTINKRVGR